MVCHNVALHFKKRPFHLLTCNYFKKIDQNYWRLLFNVYNESDKELPKKWEDVCASLIKARFFKEKERKTDYPKMKKSINALLKIIKKLKLQTINQAKPTNKIQTSIYD